MLDFLFVWERAARNYPVRYWVRANGQPMDAGPAELELMNGVIDVDHVEELLGALRARYPEPQFVVERMSGSSWDSVADNFPGLYLY